MLLIALAASVGGILSALSGWQDSKTAFSGSAFRKSIPAIVLSGVGFAVAYANIAPTGLDYLTAVLSGAGIDAVSNRLKGSLRKSQ